MVYDDGFNLKALKMNLLKFNEKCERARNEQEAIDILLSKYLKENNVKMKYTISFINFLYFYK